MSSALRIRLPVCDPHTDPPLFADCWYNCTLEDISEEDKKRRLHKVIPSFGNKYLKPHVLFYTSAILYLLVVTCNFL